MALGRNRFCGYCCTVVVIILIVAVVRVVLVVIAVVAVAVAAVVIVGVGAVVSEAAVGVPVICWRYYSEGREWMRFRREKGPSVFDKPIKRTFFFPKIVCHHHIGIEYILGCTTYLTTRLEERNWMIAFDRHIQSMEEEGMADYELICRYLFSSIRLEICGKIRFFFRLY